LTFGAPCGLCGTFFVILNRKVKDPGRFAVFGA